MLLIGTRPAGFESATGGLEVGLHKLLAQFPHLHITLEAMIAQEETVAIRILSEGTNHKLFNAVVPLTGGAF